MPPSPDESDPRPDNPVHGDFIDVRPGMRWECVMCGKCCSNIFSKRWLEPYVVPATGPTVDDHCTFFDAPGRRCTIHPTRPTVCRDHPFIITKRGDVHRLQVHSRCPGVGSGPEIDVRSVVCSLLDHINDLYDMDFMVDWSTLGSGELGIYRIK